MMREGWTGREIAVERVVELWDKKLQYFRFSELNLTLLRSHQLLHSPSNFPIPRSIKLETQNLTFCLLI